MKCQINLLSNFKVFCFSSRHKNVISLLIRHYSSRNPYEVLGLKATSSTSDIKKAYIKLCKELHPDKKPGDASQHKKFVELNDAYTTLVNETSRKQFDNSSNETSFKDVHRGFHNQGRTTSNPFERSTKEQPWYERDIYKEQEEYFNKQKKNYHITFQKNQIWILYGCFFLVVTGYLMYYAAYSYAKHYTLKKVDERSRRLRESHLAQVQNAMDTGREKRLELLRKKWNSE